MSAELSHEKRPPIRFRRKKPSNICNARKAWSVRDHQRLFDLYSAGKFFKDIAEDLGRSVPAVQNRVRNLGLRRRRPRRSQPGVREYISFTSAEQELMEREYLKGTSMARIAELLNVSASLVVKRCKNFPPRISNVSVEESEEIKSKYAGGASIRDIADEHNLSTSTVGRHLKVVSRFCNLDDDEKEIIADRFEDGCSIPCIARRINRNSEAVREYIRKNDFHNETLETDQVVDDLFSGGMALTEISRKLELPLPAIRQALRRLGRTAP